MTGNEGNHGEDVKEYYFYLDSTPTHSYMKYLYKYPQAEFPYAQLVEENRRRGKDQPEFELIDTGVFNEDRYFDVFVEYAKADVEDILIKITVTNRGPEAATLHLCRPSGFAIPGRGAKRDAEPQLSHGEQVSRIRRLSSTILIQASAGCTARARRNCCLRKRNQHSSGCLASPIARLT